MKATDVGKTVAIDAGKKLVEKAAKKLSTPKSQLANVMIPPEENTKIVNEGDTSAINLNKQIDGSSVNRSTASNAIAIQDLVKRLNGSGLKLHKFVSSSFLLLFFLPLKMMADMLQFTEIPFIDESMEEYEFHEYDSITGTNLHIGGDIRISIESQDVFTHPSESYLIF